MRDREAAREALGRMAIGCDDPAVLDIVFEAARLAPTDAIPQAISTTRLLCGVVTVGDRLDDFAGSGAPLRRVAAAFRTPRWADTRKRIFADFAQDPVDRAYKRLEEGFSPNCTRILTRAAGEGRANLSAASLISALLDPQGRDRSSRLYSIFQDSAHLRSQVLGERAAPAPVSLPPRTSRAYAESIRKSFGYVAAIPPNRSIQLGAIGVVKDGVFSQVTLETSAITSIADDKRPGPLPIDTYPTRSRPSGAIANRSGASVSTPDDGTTSIAFSRSGASFLSVTGGRWVGFANTAPVAEAILARFKDGLWDLDWHIVTEILEADRATVLISAGANGSVRLAQPVSASSAGEPVRAAELRDSRDLACALVDVAGLTPLFRLGKIEKRLLGSARFAFL